MSGASTESINHGQKPVLTMSGHANTIGGVMYLPEGDRVVTCSWDKSVRVWNTTTGEEEGMRMEHGAIVRCVGVTTDGRRILSGGFDRKLKVWEVETHKLVEVWEGHERWAIRSVAISPDGKIPPLLGSWDHTIRKWDSVTGKAVGEPWQGHTSKIYSLALSPDGTHISSASGDRTIRCWD
ncbi:hypothetical protein HYDPIDRAFT_85922, partial [Hydnomerulius pinastri MD-312]